MGAGGRGSTDQGTAGQDAEGQGAAGQDTAGQDAEGQDAAGQDTAGQDAAGQGVSERDAAPVAHASGNAPLAPRARLWPALCAVYRAQLSRARVARMPLLFVATFQSLGIMVLMRGVVDGGVESRAVVAGASVLVVAFVALNLLAQYFGQLRAGGGLDHYATLPVPAAAVVLGAAGAYASFTVPGVVVTAVAGGVLFQLPLGGLWVLAAVIPLAGAALAGVGAALGLLAPKPELATLCGQLGMSAALLLGVLPGDGLPAPVGWARDLLPSTYGVTALARALQPHPDWGLAMADLGVCAAVGAAALTLATWAYRRAAVR
jgi:ABC-2 type transport system permease protein